MAQRNNIIGITFKMIFFQLINAKKKITVNQTLQLTDPKLLNGSVYVP